MSSKRKRIFGTVKFRVALWFAALFAVSAAVCLPLAYYVMRKGLLEAADRELEAEARELVHIYLTGRRYKQFDREIPAALVSRPTLAAFNARLPGVRLLLGFENRNLHGTFRTYYGVCGGKLYELRRESDGTVYSRLVEPDHHVELLQNAFDDRSLAEGSSNVTFLLLDRNGRKLAGSRRARSLPAEAKTAENGEGGGPDFDIAAGDRSDFRVIRLPMFDGRVIETGRNLARTYAMIRDYSLIHAGTFIAVLCIGSLCGWLIARKFIAGVVRVSEAARDIAGGDFSRRVPGGNEGAEIDELVDTFNLMNANTERYFEELRMVTDNVAHDLRTPLTRMRGLAEVTVSGPPDLSAYKEMAGVIAEECGQMLQLINTMLEITRTGSKIDALELAPVDLSRMAEVAVDLFGPLAEDRHIALTLELPSEPVVVAGERIKLQRVVANLIDNALKFTPDEGRITVSLENGNDIARFRVADTGCGIKPEEIGHVFERFFRSDSSRSRPGNGLGLALVQAIVSAHRGRIFVESEFGRGSVFTVELPLWREHA